MPVETAQLDNFTVGATAKIAFGNMTASRLSLGICRCRKWIQTEYQLQSTVGLRSLDVGSLNRGFCE